MEQNENRPSLLVPNRNPNNWWFYYEFETWNPIYAKSKSRLERSLQLNALLRFYAPFAIWIVYCFAAEDGENITFYYVV